MPVHVCFFLSLSVSCTFFWAFICFESNISSLLSPFCSSSESWPIHLEPTTYLLCTPPFLNNARVTCSSALSGHPSSCFWWETTLCQTKFGCCVLAVVIFNFCTGSGLTCIPKLLEPQVSGKPRGFKDDAGLFAIDCTACLCRKLMFIPGYGTVGSMSADLLWHHSGICWPIVVWFPLVVFSLRAVRFLLHVRTWIKTNWLARFHICAMLWCGHTCRHMGHWFAISIFGNIFETIFFSCTIT